MMAKSDDFMLRILLAIIVLVVFMRTLSVKRVREFKKTYNEVMRILSENFSHSSEEKSLLMLDDALKAKIIKHVKNRHYTPGQGFGGLNICAVQKLVGLRCAHLVNSQHMRSRTTLPQNQANAKTKIEASSHTQ
jgi:hypothetical protein